MSRWTHSICDACWSKRNPIRQATRVPDATPETCCFCQAEHSSGIYLRYDPDSLKCGGDRGYHATGGAT